MSSGSNIISESNRTSWAFNNLLFLLYYFLIYFLLNSIIQNSFIFFKSTLFGQRQLCFYFQFLYFNIWILIRRITFETFNFLNCVDMLSIHVDRTHFSDLRSDFNFHFLSVVLAGLYWKFEAVFGVNVRRINIQSGKLLRW